jgi:hypothetical protein
MALQRAISSCACAAVAVRSHVAALPVRILQKVFIIILLVVF